MKLLIEGYHYKEEAIKSLGRLMGDLAWRDGTKSKNYVGYYYMFVLSLFGQGKDSLKLEFRQKTRKKFRENILAYLGEHYQFFSLQLKPKACNGDSDTDDDRPLDANFNIRHYIYEISAEIPDYELYRIDSYHIRTAQQMEKKDYPDPSGNYFVYDLELMPRQFEHIDIQKVLSAEFLAEAEIRRKTGTAKLGWEEEWQGTPVYKTGKEIMEIMKR